MHKWCAFEIKEQPGLTPQMAEAAQLVLSLRHMTQLTVKICRMTTCYLSSFLFFFEAIMLVEKFRELFFVPSSTVTQLWSCLSQLPYCANILE